MDVQPAHEHDHGDAHGAHRGESHHDGHGQGDHGHDHHDHDDDHGGHHHAGRDRDGHGDDDHGGHDHAEGGHPHGRGVRARLGHALRPHSHDAADAVDDALLVSRAGTRALAISLGGLLLTAILQAIVYALSGSVGLLADTIHNFADGLTAIPLGIAFLMARRPPTARYTYGFGRAEDLAGSSVVLVMAVSAVITTWQAVSRLVHPHRIGELGLVAVAGLIGFAGNELAAEYRIRVGRRIGSAALVADGNHARTDGFTSLAVVLGAVGVALGWQDADPVVGLVITAAILLVLRGTARDIYRRLMDAVDPALVDQARREAAGTPGVLAVHAVRVRWIGHELRAELDVGADSGMTLDGAHDIAEEVRHRLLHRLHRFADATVHVDPVGSTDDAHRLTAHHYPERPRTAPPPSRRRRG